VTDRQFFKRTEKRLAGSTRPTTDAKTSARMGKVRQHGTAPELLARQACRSLGMHYRISNEDLPGSPDLANRSRRWAIFVHGCFWHRHAGCSKSTIPKKNSRFWSAKFERNVARDLEVRAALRRLGFRVLTLWQCEAESPGILVRCLKKFFELLDSARRVEMQRKNSVTDRI
jgi:DNA mismatch endonuclease, patch repair protein